MIGQGSRALLNDFQPQALINPPPPRAKKTPEQAFAEFAVDEDHWRMSLWVNELANLERFRQVEDMDRYRVKVLAGPRDFEAEFFEQRWLQEEMKDELALVGTPAEYDGEEARYQRFRQAKLAEKAELESQMLGPQPQPHEASTSPPALPAPPITTPTITSNSVAIQTEVPLEQQMAPHKRPRTHDPFEDLHERLRARQQLGRLGWAPQPGAGPHTSPMTATSSSALPKYP